MNTIQIIIFSLIGLQLIFIIFLLVKIFSIKKYLNSLFGDKNSESIEKILKEYVSKVKDFHKDIEEIKDFSHVLYEMSEKSVQKIGFVRFNPFGDVGGDQSFSVALLDYKNNGIVITSLFGRDGTRIYSKPIKGGSSPNHLADEEKKAIEEAVKNYKKGD